MQTAPHAGSIACRQHHMQAALHADSVIVAILRRFMLQVTISVITSLEEGCDLASFGNWEGQSVAPKPHI